MTGRTKALKGFWAIDHIAELHSARSREPFITLWAISLSLRRSRGHEYCATNSNRRFDTWQWELVETVKPSSIKRSNTVSSPRIHEIISLCLCLSVCFQKHWPGFGSSQSGNTTFLCVKVGVQRDRGRERGGESDREREMASLLDGNSTSA